MHIFLDQRHYCVTYNIRNPKLYKTYVK